MGLREVPTGCVPFSSEEQAEFADAFERIKERLPALFQSFWHRWEYLRDEPPAMLVYAQDGAVALQLSRSAVGGYRVVGISRHRRGMYSDGATTIAGALRTAGLA